jgi:hypothetical protein
VDGQARRSLGKRIYALQARTAEIRPVMGKPAWGVADLGSDVRMEARSPHSPAANPVLHYLAILKAARDFGLGDAEIAAVAGAFDPLRPRCGELADALADLILARAS